MNNEIGRKITSLTLMTIMLAGGMSVAFPGVMPAAHAANANLFVSAENSQFDNYMSGPQVIEVVVIDSDINDTDQKKGEPDVTVNGKILRMVQAVDGNWYGYFADRRMAQIADSTSTDNTSQGLDFGRFCSPTSAGAVITNLGDPTGSLPSGGLSSLTLDFGDTNGVAIPINSTGTAIGSVTGSPTGDTIGNTCTTPDSSDVIIGNTTNPRLNVVREAKDPLAASAVVEGGQININPDFWPFVQIYTLNPTGNVIIQYNKGGGAQSVTLTFDTVDQFAGVALDRTIYTTGAQVHATITDLWLNIDPTDEDSWTFGAITNGSASTNYQVFDENGNVPGDVAANAGKDSGLTDRLLDLMCETNCVLLLNPDVQGKGNVITLEDNDDSQIENIVTADDADATTFRTAGGNLDGKIPLTVTEQGPNSGVFGSYDETDTSALIMNTDAVRGTSATIDYNETPVTILVGFDFATIDIQPVDDEWNSGEEIPVVLVDGDANKNSRADEDLDLFNPDVALIPSLISGDPFTLGEAGTEDGTVTRAAYITFPTLLPNGTLGTISSTAVADVTVQKFSDRALINSTSTTTIDTLVFDLGTNVDDFQNTVLNGTDFHGFDFSNIDVRGFTTTGTVDLYLLNSSGRFIDTSGLITTPSDVGATLISSGVSPQSVNQIDQTVLNSIYSAPVNSLTNNVGLAVVSSDLVSTPAAPDSRDAVVVDFFSFGFTNEGLTTEERVSNQIIRIEAEESGDNTATFEGTLEYTMLNQLNILDPNTYTKFKSIADDPNFIVIEDLTDEDAPRVNYLDLGADGVSTQIADQEEAPSHSGVVSFDQDSYKAADTVVITIDDLDLNVDSDLIDIYTVVTGLTESDVDNDQVGNDVSGSLETFSFGSLGRLADVTFDDVKWQDTGSGCNAQFDDGLGATGFTLVETGPATGSFQGDFQIPADWCRSDSSAPETVTGLDMEVNYVDFRDASGEIIEVGDSAGVRANTGSISLDRTVYPVPFGVPDNFATNTSDAADGRSVFPVHLTAQTTFPNTLGAGEFLSDGDLTIHVRVNDPDFDISASGEDKIAQNNEGVPIGPVKITVLRGSNAVVLGYAGGPSVVEGVIDVGDNAVVKNNTATNKLVFVNDGIADSTGTDVNGVEFFNSASDSLIRQFGEITEIAPDAGIFEADIDIRYTDGPASSLCPVTNDYTPINGKSSTGTNPVTDRFDTNDATNSNKFCVLQGDILQVEYTDPADASGDVNTVTDSATFDLRNGVLQSDKSVYIIGSDMILTLIEPDFDLDNDAAETFDLDLIEWDSDADTVTMGDLGGVDTGFGAKFDPEPTNFRETGDSTGIFQIVIEIPDSLGGDNLERGEEAVLEYTDWGPSGSDFVGDDNEDINLTVFTSNFGATVELDQKVYTWSDKVYITIVAPDHNFDSDLIDEIGNTNLDPIKVSTRGFNVDRYKLVETGTDTGIFTGEMILTGFKFDADGDPTTGNTDGFDTNPRTSADDTGPTDGFIETTDDDGLTVSFEFSEDETVVGSALIRWNIGEVQWLEASYPASGTGVTRIIDPDMNLDPEAVNNFDVDVWSDSDAGGIDLTVTETNEATGIFEGTVFFTTTDESSGHRLRVAEGDTVTSRYEDNTLPSPYTTADELDITATTLIGTVVPPLERAPAANLRTVDAFGNSLDSVSVDQQVQISADLANGQDKEQSFAYLVQIQDANGVTVSLAWITGSLSGGQSFSPALSWIPTEAGTYTATAFVWESVDNPTALSPPVSTTVNVS